MKKLILTACAVTCAASVFAQGTVNFNNRVVGSVVTHIYAPNPLNVNQGTIGNGSSDTSSGSTSWAGYTVIGAAGTSGQYGGATTFAQLLAAPGSNQAEGSLVPATPTTTFRTGAGGGFVAGVGATLGNVLPDAAVATLELVAWDNSGLYPTWTQARLAWVNGTIAAGTSGELNVANIGGTFNTPPNLVGLQSFNLYFVPEPSTFALAGLGAAALLIFRRRK
jgi:hypothetical protein